MKACSKCQQQLREAALQLPALDPNGYGHSASLLHPRVTALREEYQPEDYASSSGQLNYNASSSPFLPLRQTWKYQPCDQPSSGESHQRANNGLIVKTVFKMYGIFLQYSWLEFEDSFFGKQNCFNRTGLVFCKILPLLHTRDLKNYCV